MGKRILLADDSITIQKVVELTFSEEEYQVSCVSNGAQALKKITPQDAHGWFESCRYCYGKP